MIINTGQRTDIPAFYSKWFINRINEGYVLVRNPYYPKFVTKFILDPSVVDVIGFCTKNPQPMFKYLDKLSIFKQFWYITITGFEKDIEPNVISIDEAISAFKYLSASIGKKKVGLRYTPIIINDKYTIERHIKTFEYILANLEGYTDLVAYGFVDIYDKLKRNYPELKDCNDEDKIYISKCFLEISKKHHMELRLCSKEKWLIKYNINIDGCMLLKDYEKACGLKLLTKNKMQARKGYCSCFLSNDIGSYNSCLHLCKYCYANSNKESVIKNYKKHDEDSPFLIGSVQEDDIIKEAKQESWIIK